MVRTAKILDARGLAHPRPGVGADIFTMLLSLLWSAVSTTIVISIIITSLYISTLLQSPRIRWTSCCPFPFKRPTGRDPHQPHPGLLSSLGARAVAEILCGLGPVFLGTRMPQLNIPTLLFPGPRLKPGLTS